MTTRAKDFKFAGAMVQRLYLVVVALTKNRLSAQYGWFCHGRSHIYSGFTVQCDDMLGPESQTSLGSSGI